MIFRKLKELKVQTILIILFLIITPVALTPWIQGNDGPGNYSYLRSAFIDKDIDFQNEKEYYNQTRKISSIRQDPNTGEYYSQYPFGTSLMWMPYFLAAHLFAIFTDFPSNGYSEPYVYMISIGSAVNGFIALLLILRM